MGQNTVLIAMVTRNWQKNRNFSDEGRWWWFKVKR
jgi:hypothetical protein